MPRFRPASVNKFPGEQPPLRVGGKLMPRILEATPIQPWSKRRVNWALKIAKAGEYGLRVNCRYSYKTNTNEASAKDLSRLVKEGFAVLTLSQQGRSSNASHRLLRLTPAGWELLRNVPGEFLVGP